MCSKRITFNFCSISIKTILTYLRNIQIVKKYPNYHQRQFPTHNILKILSFALAYEHLWDQGETLSRGIFWSCEGCLGKLNAPHK